MDRILLFVEQGDLHSQMIAQSIMKIVQEDEASTPVALVDINTSQPELQTIIESVNLIGAPTLVYIRGDAEVGRQIGIAREWQLRKWYKQCKEQV